MSRSRGIDDPVAKFMIGMMITMSTGLALSLTADITGYDAISVEAAAILVAFLAGSYAVGHIFAILVKRPEVLGR